MLITLHTRRTEKNVKILNQGNGVYPTKNVKAELSDEKVRRKSLKSA